MPAAPATLAPAQAAAGTLHALDGKEIPGTSPDNWNPLQEYNAPSPGTDMEATATNDLAYNIAIFDFASPADAATFFASPPGAINGWIAGALAYTPLAASTGAASPSRAVDLRTCGSNGEAVSILPSGQCSSGAGSFSAGVATITQRGALVVFVGYLSSNGEQYGSPAAVAQLKPYTQDVLNLLLAVGLR